jgi:hypothetical protein
MQALASLKKLLSIYQSDKNLFKRSRQLDGLCDEYGVGQMVGAMWEFTEADKVRIGVVIRNTWEVDPQTPSDAWRG